MVEDAGEEDEEDDPLEFHGEAEDQIPAVDFFEEDGGREVSEVHERGELDEAVPWLGEHVERKHVAGEEETEEHVNEEERADFEPPEADEAHAGFEEVAEQKSQDE